jgi:diguanylate cyclase (GGDEF)-like protein
MLNSGLQRLKLFVTGIENSLSLRQQLGIATALLCFVMVAMVAMAAAYIARQQASESIGGEMAELARTIADRLDRGMSGRFQDAALLSELDPLRDVWTADDPAAVRQVLEQLKKQTSSAAWIGFAAPDGIVKAATGSILEGASVVNQSWFRAGKLGIIASDVHDPNFDPLGGPSLSDQTQRFLDIAAPVHGLNGELAGVLGIRVSWRWAADLLKSSLSVLDPASETDVSIFAWDGRLLLGADKAGLADSRLREILRLGAGSYTDITGAAPALAGFAVTRGYGAFPGLGWIVVARRPTAIAFAPGNRLVLTILAIGLAAGALGSAVAGVISRRVSHPIRKLAYEADRIGRDAGSVMLPHVSGSLEITQLSNALRSLLRRLDLTQLEKTEVEEKSAAEAQRLNRNIDALRELADTDPLTGLPNRRGVATVGEDVMSSFSWTDTPFSVLVVDIDHFKRINDAYGHTAGDEVIRHVANLVKSAIRPTDHAARFGGEEFVAILRDCSLEKAGEAAERARRAIESGAIIHDRVAISCTASIGVAVVEAADRDIQDVIARADAALYLAKASGRNRVELSAAPPAAIQEAA